MNALRLRYVEGVNPSRWLAVWRERHPESPAEHERVDQASQFDAVLAGDADVAIVRGEVTDARLHRVRLFDERAVAVAEKDHALAAFDEVTLADLEGETMLDISALSQEDAVAVAASGAGIAVLPMSSARLHGGPASIARPITDAPVWPVSLVWLRAADSEMIQDFVGVARGRKATSSRGEAPAEPEEPKRQRPSAARPAAKSRPRPAHRIVPKPRPKRRGR